MENDKLEALLLVLRKNGVKEYRLDGLTLIFDDHARLVSPMVDNNQAEEITTQKKQESDDDILFYSARR